MLTRQSLQTIYQRKTQIRQKLSIPEADYNRQIKKSAFAKQKVHNFKLKSAPFLYAFNNALNAD